MTSSRPKIGDTALEANVYDSAGNAFRLSDTTGNDRNSMILLYRGHW